VADVSESGLRVRLKGPVNPGDEVEIGLTLQVASQSWNLVGDVRWCEPGLYDTFIAGVHLRRYLTHMEMSHLT
jgi:hypothetical protein